LAILNSTVINKDVLLSSLCIDLYSSGGHMFRSALRGSYGGFVFGFLRNLHAALRPKAKPLKRVQDILGLVEEKDMTSREQ
jgi:hypothetical protein